MQERKQKDVLGNESCSNLIINIYRMSSCHFGYWPSNGKKENKKISRNEYVGKFNAIHPPPIEPN